MKKGSQLVCALLLAFVVIAGASRAALAGIYTSCAVSDVQAVKVGSTNYSIFQACGFFWYVPTDADGSRLFSSVVMSAFLSGRKVNVQCGANGGTCNNFVTSVYIGTQHSSNTIWSVETVALQP